VVISATYDNDINTGVAESILALFHINGDQLIIPCATAKQDAVGYGRLRPRATTWRSRPVLQSSCSDRL